MNHYDPAAQRACMNAIVHLRRRCRQLVNALEDHWDANRSSRRHARLLRNLGSPEEVALAESIEREVACKDELITPLREELARMGAAIWNGSAVIARVLPQPVLLDLLNVNPVDRSAIDPRADLLDVAFVHAAENSVEQRGKDWNDTPLFKAAHFHFADRLANEPLMQQAAHQATFGVGGMFEFAPRYRLLSDGSMQRLPPPLRLADPAIDHNGVTNGTT